MVESEIVQAVLESEFAGLKACGWTGLCDYWPGKEIAVKHASFLINLTAYFCLEHVHVYEYTYIHTYIHTCMHICKDTTILEKNVEIHSYTYVHTYIHTYKHTLQLKRRLVVVVVSLCLHLHTYIHAHFVCKWLGKKKLADQQAFIQERRQRLIEKGPPKCMHIHIHTNIHTYIPACIFARTPQF